MWSNTDKSNDQNSFAWDVAMTKTAGVLQNTETAYPSRTPEWVRVENLF